MDRCNDFTSHGPKRFSTTLLLVILLAAIFLVIVPMPAYAQEEVVLNLQGRVYEGKVGDESRPIQGVTVSLYGANNPYPFEGKRIARTTTDGKGWYGLEILNGYEYYSIRENNLPGYESIGATTVHGKVRTNDWIEYVVPLKGQTLTGNKFWDIRVAEPSLAPEGSDLTVLSVNNWEFDVDTGTLTLFVEVSNEGNVEASETAVYVRDSEHEWLHKYGSVPALDPNEMTPVEVLLEIPEELRGTTRTFRVIIDSEDMVKEINEENNDAMTPVITLPLPEERGDEEDSEATTPVLPLPPPEQRPEEELPEDELPLLALVTAATVIMVSMIFIFRRATRIRRRKEWQEKAEEEEPPEPCQPCNRYCQKKIKPDLAPFRMASLTLVAHDPVSNERIKERLIEGEIVNTFNEVITARRRRAKLEKLMEQVKPLSDALLQTILEWLRGEPAARDVSIAGHLEGSKVDCQFILYHCEHKGDLNDWTVEAKWKATITHERDELVGTLTNLDPLETEISERQTPVLIRLLMQFVEKF
jgi:hypothetical protein